METPIRTPEAAGREIRAILRNTTRAKRHQRRVLRPRRDGGGRRRQVDHQPGAAAVEAAGGNPARRVLAEPKVWVAVEAGVAAEEAEADGADKRNRTVAQVQEVWE